MFNVKKFIDRKHWKLEDLANRLFEKGGTSRVGNWSTGTSSPRYEVMLKLIELGVTAEELLGKEHADLLIKNSLDDTTAKTFFGVDAATHQPAVPSEIARDSEFQEGLQAAMDAKIEAKVDAKVKAVVADMLREYGLPPRNGSV